MLANPNPNVSCPILPPAPMVTIEYSNRVIHCWVTKQLDVVFLTPDRQPDSERFYYNRLTREGRVETLGWGEGSFELPADVATTHIRALSFSEVVFMWHMGRRGENPYAAK